MRDLAPAGALAGALGTCYPPALPPARLVFHRPAHRLNRYIVGEPMEGVCVSYLYR